MKIRSLLATSVAGLSLLLAACAEGPLAPEAAPRAVSLAVSLAASAAGPQIIAGNPVCTTQQGQRVGLGYLGGTDDQETLANTTYTITVAGLGTITYTTNGDNTGIASWSSTFPIDGVIMKGGQQGSNLYVYTGATSGAGEFTAINEGSGTPANISHLNFCWYGRFSPSVNGAATFTRDYAWSIVKSATAPASVPTGTTLTVSYAVAMSRTGDDADFAIGGTVTVANTGYGAAGTVDGVTVDVGGVAATVSCPATFPTTLANGASLDCSYSAALPTNATRTVTATVNASGLWRPSSATTEVSFGAPTTEIDETATVSDTRVPAGFDDVNGPTTIEYSLTFGPYTACVPVTIDNRASFVTNDSRESDWSDASVTVNVTGCGTGDAEEIGTAFAYVAGASTFTSVDPSIKRWGWTLNFGAPGTATYDVYVGAGQNDLSKGTNVGTVTITYSGTTVTATYNLLPNYVVMSEHLYAGATALPTTLQGKKTVTTVAPGQYTVNVSGGNIWVIAHAVIGYVQP